MTRLAERLADLQSLTMPIPKDRTLEDLSIVFDQWFPQNLKDSYLNGRVREEIIKKNYELLAKYNVVDEIEWLRRVLVEVGSPIVLAHNDLNRRNILVREVDNQIFFIDFDSSRYTYRGTDFGQYFSNWCQKETDFEYRPFPSDQQMFPFIDAYIKRMTEIFGESFAKQEINSRQRLIMESKVFALYGIFKDIEYCLYMCDETPNKDFLV